MDINLLSSLNSIFGQWEKQRAVTAVAAVSAVTFGIKDLPKHTLAIHFFSLSFFIAMTLVTIKTLTDHREKIKPFENLKRYLALTTKILSFSRCRILFFLVVPLHFLHFCIVVKDTSSRKRCWSIIIVSKITLWHSWHFGIFKVCNSVKNELGHNRWNFSNTFAFSALSHFLGCWKCKNAESASDFSRLLFFCCCHYSGLVQSHIYTICWTKPKSEDDNRWKKKNPPMPAGESIKVCQSAKCAKG